MTPTGAVLRLLDRRAGERDRLAQEEDARVGREAVAGVVAQDRVDDLHRARAVVADEEDARCRPRGSRCCPRCVVPSTCSSIVLPSL